MRTRLPAPLIIASLVVVLIGLAIYKLKMGRPAYRPPRRPSSATSADRDVPPPARYPVSTGAGLNTGRPTIVSKWSALSFVQAMEDTIGTDRFRSLFWSDDLIKRIVRTVERAPRHEGFNPRLRPFHSLKSEILAQKTGSGFTLPESNFARYASYVEFLRRTDIEKMVTIYVYFYPRFQEIYRGTGSTRYFNDRLVEAIDDLLDAPIPQPPIRLVQAEGFYRFADPQLERLSAGQKLMIRIGPNNAAIVKAKLREVRMLITHLDQ